MKQKNLYYILVTCLVIISILLTMIVMSHQNSPNNPNNPNIQNNPNYPNKYYNTNTIHNIYDRDINYAYDYNGNWFQPSIWWNSLWYPNRRHMYDRHNRRDMYDRRDGLKIENRYNFIQNQPSLHDTTLTEKQNTEKHHVNGLQSQHKIELVKPQSGSLFPLPTLTSISSSSSSSSSPIMPEEIAMSPMSKMHIENSIHSISAFTDSVPVNTNNYNFDYKGADSKNQKPLPVDMMASESIYLQPNTVANEIIKPNIAMEHPNPM